MLVNAKKGRKSKHEEVDSERDVVIQDPMDNPFWGDGETAVVCNDSESIKDSVFVDSDTHCFDKSVVFLSEQKALWDQEEENKATDHYVFSFVKEDLNPFTNYKQVTKK